MGANDLNGLLETILSRSVIWNFVNPTTKQIKEYFGSFDGPKLDKAIAISGNRVGLIQAILNQDTEHPLIQAIDSAKSILSSNHFDRLLKIETLHKDPKQVLLILEALGLISKSALEYSAAKNDIKQVKQWHRRLNVVIEATQLIRSNINTKLVLSKTFLVI